LIGGRCKRSNVFSQAVLMAEDLPPWCGELELLLSYTLYSIPTL
jgi:hypothetical protein